MKSPPALGKRTTPEAYQQAQWVAEGLLIGAAQARRVVTYLEVGRAVEQATGHQVYGHLFGRLLEDLEVCCHRKYGVLLSAVVVNSKTLAPGSGFIEMARRFGLAKPGESEIELDRRLRAETFRRFAG